VEGDRRIFDRLFDGTPAPEENPTGRLTADVASSLS
jgi:hypothetical protein